MRFSLLNDTHTHKNIGRQKRQIRRRRVSITTATASTPIFRLTFIAWIFARSQFSHSLIPWISGRPVPPLLTNSRHAIIFRARYFKFYTNSKAFPTQSVRLIKTRNINGSVYLVGVVGCCAFDNILSYFHPPSHTDTILIIIIITITNNIIQSNRLSLSLCALCECAFTMRGEMWNASKQATSHSNLFNVLLNVYHHFPIKWYKDNSYVPLILYPIIIHLYLSTQYQESERYTIAARTQTYIHMHIYKYNKRLNTPHSVWNLFSASHLAHTQDTGHKMRVSDWLFIVSVRKFSISFYISFFSSSLWLVLCIICRTHTHRLTHSFIAIDCYCFFPSRCCINVFLYNRMNDYDLIFMCEKRRVKWTTFTVLFISIALLPANFVFSNGIYEYERARARAQLNILSAKNWLTEWDGNRIDKQAKVVTFNFHIFDRTLFFPFIPRFGSLTCNSTAMNGERRHKLE